MSYSIEDLDVYRKTVAAGSDLYRSAEAAAGAGGSLLAESLKERALRLAAGVAGGLGFWERKEKLENFAASKQAVLESLPLLEMMVSMGLMSGDERSRLAEQLRDTARMVGGLLRGAQRREQAGGDRNNDAAQEVREGGIVYQ